MNILFFITPKSEVAYIYDDYTMRQALEKMEYHRYSAIPIINREGEYVGTITEGDLLWYLKNDLNLELKAIENVYVSYIKRRMDNKPVSINANIEDLISKSMNQNFVPVIDDQNIFIGIIKRRDIIGYCYNKITNNKKDN
ncbi:CBS domain-containing protein [Paraclostridium ghonii]|uniref:CBS domain-containing protein n=1 Tax=Paraclostridium ghonii TaxID=29358 RepID=A0ABU0MXN3_9FIRM|nr:CBS domain-containing protein [Paeniclostridium ghonii]MCM0167152.1 CBS domain-containing protein [Paeniclostridium ghonii]MDQ0555276.1 CBS domain-containing protein [Paeniclostridium ghonii]